jgi:dTDP-glucose pyrophosphorylase
VIDGLHECGVTRFVIVTGYLSDQIHVAMAGYGDGQLDIRFVQQAQQLGTGHALKLTREAVAGTPLVLAFADIMTSPGNYGALMAQFFENHCAITAGVRDVGDPWKAAAVYFDADHNIQQIIEKPPIGTSTTPWAHAGMYCFSNGIFDYLENLKPTKRGEYEVTDAVAANIADGLRCQAVELTGYWKDLATPDDVAEAETMMRLVNQD